MSDFITSKEAFSVRLPVSYIRDNGYIYFMDNIGMCGYSGYPLILPIIAKCGREWLFLSNRVILGITWDKRLFFSVE